MAQIIKPTQAVSAEIIRATHGIALFGSIEEGAAEPWQKQVEDALIDYPEITVYNPRRDQWNKSWKQEITNPQFKDQVNWELLVLENVKTRIFYFDPKTKSPVTLAELGLASVWGAGTTTVCCPEGYWRKGNVDIICERYIIPMVNTLEELIFEAVAKTTFGTTIRRVMKPAQTLPDEHADPLPFKDL